jgi:hypothetical protein
LLGRELKRVIQEIEILQFRWFLRLAAAAGPRYAGNTDAQADPVRVKVSLAIIDAIFRDLPTIVSLPPDRVLFTLDGLRYPDLAAGGRGTYFDLMRQAFRSKATSLGYEVIDLNPDFFRHYARMRSASKTRATGTGTRQAMQWPSRQCSHPSSSSG